MAKRIATTGALAALFFVLAACGEESAEQQLAQSNRELHAQREAVRSAQELVQREESELEAARLELETARAALRDARAALSEAESHVDVSATDALLFRAIQSRLLEERDFRDLALRVEVDRGAVTLRGRVPDEETRAQALELVQEFPGVVAVADQLELLAPDAAN